MKGIGLLTGIFLTGQLRPGYALISETHAHLTCAGKIHAVGELREGAVDDKTEDVINCWKEGKALTPPALRKVNDKGIRKIDIEAGITGLMSRISPVRKQ